MADLTDTDVFMGHTKALNMAMALHALNTAKPEERAMLLERATDSLIEAANAIGCTVKKDRPHMVLMQKTETKIAKSMDAHAKGTVARAAEADELRRKLARAEAENLELLAQLAGLGEKPRLVAAA